VDLPATLAAIDANTRLLFLCSPGNPTSKVIPNAVVEEILGKFTTGMVVVDEAYIDFSGTTSACTLIEKYPNLIVLQTLSKAFGLAGIRLGMAFAREDVIQLMNNVKAPYNVNKLTAEVAHKALSDLKGFHSNIRAILAEREFLLSGLQSMTAVKKIHHSDANFILFAIPRAQDIYKTMADRGVVCRYR
jgi:histidinol-phosphate aminotransferase